MRTRDKVVIGYIDGGQVSGAFAADIATVCLGRPDRIGGIIRVQGNLLSRVRNELVQAFLGSGYGEWLLMVDTDQRLPVHVFDALIGTAHDVSHPVVSGLVFGAYPVPGQPYPTPIPAIYRHTDDDKFQALHDYPRAQVIRIDAAGTGCLLIHRSVFEKVRDSRPEGIGEMWAWFVDGPVGDEWYGEDLVFMRRLAALDIPVHCNTAAVLPHLKTFPLTDIHHAIHWERP
jgi:hypothetical protein